MKTYDELIMQLVQRALLETEDTYNIWILKRIRSSMCAANTLFEREYFTEVPVLLRVAFEHASRYYQAMLYPETITRNHKEALKLLGRSPGPGKVLEDFGESAKTTYAFLCGFAHPDLMSLALTDDKSETVRNIITMLTATTNVAIYQIITKVNPSLKATSEYEEEMGKDIHVSINNIVIEMLSKIDNAGLMKEIIQKKPLYAQGHNNLNVKIQDLLSVSSNVEDVRKVVLGEFVDILNLVNERD